ncbi:hypothetical protein ACTFIY_005934 [Dictyostelium cf. discoideum]
MTKTKTTTPTPTTKVADTLKSKKGVASTVKTSSIANHKQVGVLNNKERKQQLKKLKLQSNLSNQSTNVYNNSNSNLSHENILKSVIDSYILPLTTSTTTTTTTTTTNKNNLATPPSSFLDIKTYLPNVIVLLHQGKCLKKCLDSNNKSVESIKLRERWMELLGFLLKPNNNNLWVGVHLLCETVRVCDYEIMINKLEHWITILTTLIENQKKVLTLKNQQQNQQQQGQQQQQQQIPNTISFKEYGSIIILLSLLVEKATKWNDLKRTITNNTVMSPIVSLILLSLDQQYGYPDECKIDSMVAITSLIQSATTALKPYLFKIEQLAYPLLYSSNKSIQESTSTLIANLSQCVGINTTDLYWDISVQKILVEMNTIVDKVFNIFEDQDQTTNKSNIVDTTNNTTTTSTSSTGRTINLPNNSKLLNVGDDQVIGMLKNLSSVKFPDTPKDVHAQTSFYIKALFGLSNCLLRILSTSSSTPSPVPIDEIIKLICRILNPNLNHLAFSNLNLSFSISEMIFLIQQFHQQAFLLLSGVLKIFRKSLLVHSKTISSLLLRPLKSLNYSLMSPTIHSQIYKTITDAVESFGASSSDSLAIQVLPILLKDILPYIPEGGNSNNSMSTTQNTTLLNSSKLTISQTINNVDPTLNDFDSLSIKEDALSALSSILLHCGSYLQQQQQNNNNNNNSFGTDNSNGPKVKQVCRLEIDQLLVSLLLECQSLSSVKKNSTTYLNSSYNCWRYRSKLYECLIHCVLKPVSNIPPVLPYSIRIFTNGMSNDHNPNVRSICCKGVSICESIIHPQCPSLTNIATTTTSITFNQHPSSVYKNLLNSNTNAIMGQEDDYFEESSDSDENLNHQDDEDEDDDLENEVDNKIQLEDDDLEVEEEVEEEEAAEEEVEEVEEEEEEDEQKVKEKEKTIVHTTTTITTSQNNNIVMKTSLFNTSTLQKQATVVAPKVSKIEPNKPLVADNNDVSIDDGDDDLDLPDIED